jgi:hypothetical protein
MEGEMGKFLSGAVSWFEGKKTILGGVLVIAAAAAGVWFGKLDPATAVAVGGMGFAAIGMGDKANRHQAQILTALQGIATAGTDYRAGNKAAALEAVFEGASAPIVADYVSKLNPQPIAGASLHLSADSAEELLTAIKSVAGGGMVPPKESISESSTSTTAPTKAAMA